MRHLVVIAGALLVATVRTASADVLGDCYRNVRPDAQIAACSQIIESSVFGRDEKALAFTNRGEARTEAGALNEAIADFTAALRLRPDSARSLAGRGEARFAAGNFPGAITDYNDAIRLMPASANLYFDRGHVYLAAGSLDASIRDLTEAIRLDPNSASAYNNRGLAFRKKGDNAHAFDDYTEAIVINPVYALAYANRGYLLESQGKKREAVDDLSQALWLDPSQAEVLAALRRLGVTDEITRDSERRVAQGRVLAEANCSGCHALAEGTSPNRNAPEFPTLHRRYRLLSLRAPITRGIAAPHDQMPRFSLTAGEVDTIVAYINSLALKK